MELMLRKVNLTDNEKVIEMIFKTKEDIDINIKYFQGVKEYYSSDSKYKYYEWNSSCIEITENGKRYLIYIMKFL